MYATFNDGKIVKLPLIDGGWPTTTLVVDWDEVVVTMEVLAR